MEIEFKQSPNITWIAIELQKCIVNITSDFSKHLEGALKRTRKEFLNISFMNKLNFLKFSGICTHRQNIEEPYILQSVKYDITYKINHNFW